jgi:hypothetical protein
MTRRNATLVLRTPKKTLRSKQSTFIDQNKNFILGVPKLDRQHQLMTVAYFPCDPNRHDASCCPSCRTSLGNKGICAVCIQSASAHGVVDLWGTEILFHSGNKNATSRRISVDDAYLHVSLGGVLASCQDIRLQQLVIRLKCFRALFASRNCTVYRGSS